MGFPSSGDRNSLTQTWSIDQRWDLNLYNLRKSILGHAALSKQHVATVCTWGTASYRRRKHASLHPVPREEVSIIESKGTYQVSWLKESGPQNLLVLFPTRTQSTCKEEELSRFNKTETFVMAFCQGTSQKRNKGTDLDPCHWQQK